MIDGALTATGPVGMRGTGGGEREVSLLRATPEWQAGGAGAG